MSDESKKMDVDDEKDDAKKTEEEELDEQDILLEAAELASRFTLLRKNNRIDESKDVLRSLMKIYSDNYMIEFYRNLMTINELKVDEELVLKWKESVDKLLAENDAKKEEAEKNEGDVEIHESELERAKLLSKTSDIQTSIDTYLNIKGLTTGKNIDRYLTILRICLAWNDDQKYKKYFVDAQKLIDKGGDWDRRNKFTICTSCHYFRIRKFKEAASGLLESIATFSATEIFNYEQLVKYTIISSILSLDRPIIKEKLIDSPEIRQVINTIPVFKSFLSSFYECRYNEFFRSLIEIMKEFVRYDIYLNYHSNYYLREVRLRAYKQFLRSYKSVKLESMSQEFGISKEFLDDELSSYISADNLNCKIDKVNGIVQINRNNPKNIEYQEIIKKGDLLLNRIQRLSRIITY